MEDLMKYMIGFDLYLKITTIFGISFQF